MPPMPGSNVSCQSPQAFLPPTLMDLQDKRKCEQAQSLNNGDNSLQPMLNCSELGLLGKRAAAILLFAGCHDLSQSCSGLQPFPDSSNPCPTISTLVFCPPTLTRSRTLWEKVIELNLSRCCWSGWMGLSLRYAFETDSCVRSLTTVRLDSKNAPCRLQPASPSTTCNPGTSIQQKSWIDIYPNGSNNLLHNGLWSQYTSRGVLYYPKMGLKNILRWRVPFNKMQVIWRRSFEKGRHAVCITAGYSPLLPSLPNIMPAHIQPKLLQLHNQRLLVLYHVHCAHIFTQYWLLQCIYHHYFLLSTMDYRWTEHNWERRVAPKVVDAGHFYYKS